MPALAKVSFDSWCYATVRRMLSITIMTFALSLPLSYISVSVLLVSRHRRLTFFFFSPTEKSIRRIWKLVFKLLRVTRWMCCGHSCFEFSIFRQIAHAAASATVLLSCSGLLKHTRIDAPFDVHGRVACWVLTSADEALAKCARATARIMMNYLSMESIHGERARTPGDRRQTKQIAWNVCHRQISGCWCFFSCVPHSVVVDLNLFLAFCDFFSTLCHCLIWGIWNFKSLFFLFTVNALAFNLWLQMVSFSLCDADWNLISSRSENGAALS